MQGHRTKISIVNPIVLCQWESRRPRAGLHPEIRIFSSLCQKFLALYFFFFRASLLKRVTKHPSAAQHGTNRSVRQSTKRTEREPGGRSVRALQVNWCVHKKWQTAQKAQGSSSRKDGEAVQAPGAGVKVCWGRRACGATRAQTPLFIPTSVQQQSQVTTAGSLTLQLVP